MTGSDIKTSDPVQAATMRKMAQAAQEADWQKRRDSALHGSFHGGTAAVQIRRNRQWQKDLEAQEDSRR